MKPIAPKLPAKIENWLEEPDYEIEIDSALVEYADLTVVRQLSIDASQLKNITLTAAVFDKIELTDIKGVKVDGAALRTYKAKLLRVNLTDCRLTCAEFAEGHFEDCTFENIRFDETGFRFASFKRVRFENCILRQADFSNARFRQVAFTDCDLEDTNFISASCENVDVSTEDLSRVKGLLGLKGATISNEQLIQLAPLLASELGFHVKQ